VTPSSATVPIGQTTTLSAAIAQTNCTGLTPMWSSSSEAVATVSSSGVVTAVAAGTSTVTATVSGISGTATITVPQCVTGITLDRTTVSVRPGVTETVRATIIPSTCPGVTVEWSSSANSIAVVGAGNITGLAPGTATITARVGTVSATVAVTVLPATLGTSWDETTLRLAGSADAPSGFVAAAWAISATDVMVAAFPSFHRWDGTSWRTVPGSPFGVEAMWGSSATQIFGVGQRILQFDGTAWTEMTNPVSDRLRAVWGSGASSVYAVGQNGRILRFNGTAWTTMTSPTTANLVGVSGVGDTLVFAVGEDGSVLRYDGTLWSVFVAPNPNRSFTSIRMISPTIGYATSTEGVHRWNGTSWALDGTFPGTAIARAVWATSPTHVVVVGSFGMLHRFDGTSWSTPTRRAAGEFSQLTGVGTATFAFAGATAVRIEGGTTSLLYSAPELRSVWAFDADHALAVGHDGAVFRYRNGSWTSESIGSFANLSDVWAAGPNAVFAVGVDPISQAPVAYRHDGATWSALPAPSGTFPNTIWGTSATNIFVAGGNQNVLRFDGSAWTTVATIGPVGASAIWGTGPSDVLMVGSSGYVARFDGVGVVTPLATPTTRALVSVWGSSPANYFAGTNGQEFYRVSGPNVTPVTLPGGMSAVFALWGTGANEVFAVDFNGNVARFDGTQWQQVRVGASVRFFQALHGTPTRLFAVGPRGSVMVTR
jgi:trimeric autotransporter adhesin